MFSSDGPTWVGAGRVGFGGGDGMGGGEDGSDEGVGRVNCVGGKE